MKLTTVPHEILAEYARLAREVNTAAMEATALRADSELLRDVFAYAGSGGRVSYAAVKAGEVEELEPKWAAALARVVALQNPRGEEDRVALALMQRALPHLPKTAGTLKYRVLYVELLFAAEQFHRAAQVLEDDPELAAAHGGFLLTDLRNPYIGTPYSDSGAWEAAFNAPFVNVGLAPVGVSDRALTPFDGLYSEARSYTDGPLVSVIVTTFCPSLASLRTAVDSILRQSWENIEILIIDDASPAEFDAILEEVASLDPRIALHKQEVNGGTYLARNAGIRLAKGQFITCQDSDDFSHSQRIELQMRPLLDDQGLQATRSYCLAVQDSLQLYRRGYWPERPNASSLMLRTERARDLGGFLRARRGADSELHYRVEKRYGRKVHDLRMPLALVRILPDSLSRSDFRKGWHHEARRSFVSTFSRWHQTASPDALHVGMDDTPPIPVASRLAVEQEDHEPLDVVFVGDWSVTYAKQSQYLCALKELSRLGLSVGVLHLDSAWYAHGKMTDVSSGVQDAINAGEISRVLSDEDRQVKLLLITDGTTVQFPPRKAARLSVDRAVLLGSGFYEVGGRIAKVMDVASCVAHARALFNTSVEWATFADEAAFEPPTGNVRPVARLAPVVPVGARRSGVRRPSSFGRPVVGVELCARREGQVVMSDVLRSLSREPGAPEVWMLGNRPPGAVERHRGLPDNVIYFHVSDMHHGALVNSVDFYLVGIGSGVDLMEVTAAVQAGAVVLAPADHEGTLGDMAVYFSSVEAMNRLIQAYADGPWMLEMRARALKSLEIRLRGSADLISFCMDAHARSAPV